MLKPSSTQNTESSHFFYAVSCVQRSAFLDFAEVQFKLLQAKHLAVFQGQDNAGLAVYGHAALDRRGG